MQKHASLFERFCDVFNQGMRVRKALLQEIRDRRRSMADHSNSNFQVESLLKLFTVVIEECL
jgi:hypothetical protein